MSDRAKLETELSFLSELERREVVTQMSLAQKVSVSVGLVNALLKRAMKKGFVKAKAAPYKRYAYYLTPKGFNEKSRLVAQYLEVSLDFFRTARTQYTALFNREKMAGYDTFILAGSGELAEIAILSAGEANVEVKAILSGSTLSGTSEQTHMFGVPVINQLALSDNAVTIVISDSKEPQTVYDQLIEQFGLEHRIIAPDFLCITPEPLEFRPPKVAPKNRSETRPKLIGWSVVHTRPHQEERASSNLARQGFEVWAPVTKRSRRHARRIDTILEPLFPGYIFVRLDANKPTWAPINGTFGVKYLIAQDRTPTFLPNHFVEGLMATTNDDAVVPRPATHVASGDSVKFVSGPFVDSVATVLKLLPKERVQLLLQVLGGKNFSFCAQKRYRSRALSAIRAGRIKVCWVEAIHPNGGSMGVWYVTVRHILVRIQQRSVLKLGRPVMSN